MPYEYQLRRVYVPPVPKPDWQVRVESITQTRWRSLYLQAWKPHDASLAEGRYRQLKPHNPHRLMADIAHLYKRLQIVEGKLVKVPAGKPWVSPWAEGWKKRRARESGR